MKMMIPTLILAAICQAQPTFNGLVDAEEVHARAGVGNFMEKVRSGQEVTVAYLGGSITAMNGWRNLTTDWLRATYPNAKFKEVHAAIGGTGSELGAYRVGHDALRHNPDLLFVEFATNDAGCVPESIWRTMEGIVSQTWRKNIKTDIVFTYTITGAMKGEYLKGKMNRAASAMEQLADFYGIPSICFGTRIAKLLAEDKLVMGKGDLKPNDTRMLFADDSVHPHLAGHKVYLEAIIAGFTQMKDSKPVQHDLSRCFVEDNMEKAQMIEITKDMLTGTWDDTPPQARWFGDRMGHMWHSGTPGSTLKFSFTGTHCMIYDLLGPDGGQVNITVDGKPAQRPTARFDSYCTYHRIATLHVYRGKGGKHDVEITIDPNQPSRQPVAFRLKDPETELKTPKYNGTNFWPAKLLVLGE